MKNKRAAISIETVVVIVIAVIVILLLTTGLGRQFKNFIWGINSCEAKKGVCMASCGNLEAIPAGDAGCDQEYPGKGFVCCEEPEQTITTGYGADQYEVLMYFGNEGTPLYYGERKDIKIGEKQEITIRFEGLEAAPKDLSAVVFLKDVNTGDEFYLYEDKDEIDFVADDGSNNKIMNIDNSKLKNDDWKTFKITPQEYQESRIYDLRVIVFNSSRNVIFNIDENDERLPPERYWVSEFAVKLRVKPIVEINGLSSIWVFSDDFKVQANEPYKLLKTEIAIINLDTNAKQNVYDELSEKCDSNINYVDSMHHITAFKAGNEGINILFNSGQKAFQTERYESRDEPIEINAEQNNAEILLDAASIIYTFDQETNADFADMLFERENSNMLDQYYVCAKTKVLGPDGEEKTVHTFSEQPLKLDIAPPKIENTDNYIEVVYPEPQKTVMDDLIRQKKISPNQQVTPYYWDIYPKIVIKNCYDKSGCHYYDYHYTPTTIRINIFEDDLNSYAVNTVLGLGLNYLYNSLAQKNPLNTVCPLADSGQYRHNSQPEIRFRKDDQGVFCIKAVDGVGNYWLTWKAVYNPYSIIQDVLQAGVDEATDTGSVTPVIGE